MYQYRIFRRAGRLLQGTLVALCVLLLVPVSFLVVLVAYAIYNQHHWLGYTVIALLAVPVVWLISWGRRNFSRDNALTVRGFNLTSRAGHRELRAYLKYLNSCIKRLASNGVLSDEQGANIRQKADRIDGALGHHPLNEDLIRGIAQARDDIIGPVYGLFDDIRDQLTASKARALVQDIYQPPFPVVAPLVVFYHQFTHVSEITDLYVTEPTMGEYYRVQRDVWDIMTKGDFLRYGQRLYAGINTNTYHVGRSAEDLGQVFSIVWLTYAFAQAAAIRCCTLHDWNLHHAIKDMQRQLLPCLEKTSDTLLTTIMPIIKKRIRTYAPVDRDQEQYIRETADAFSRAVTSVVQTLKNSTEGTAESARTSPGLVVSQHVDGDDPGSALELDPDEEASPIMQPVRVRKRRKSRRRSSRNKQGFFKQLKQMLKPNR